MSGLVLLLSACAMPHPHSGGVTAGMGVQVSAQPASIGTLDLGPHLRFMGAVDLTSDDARFGGLSSLRWAAGRLHSLSDQDGTWYSFRPVERGGVLVGVDEVRSTSLQDSDGAPLMGKVRSDAEAIDFVDSPCPAASCKPQAVLVTLERDHRVLRYAMRRGLPVGTPERLHGLDTWLSRQPDNEGIESLASTDGETLLISEGLRAPDGQASAMLVRPALGTGAVAGSIPLSVPAPGDHRPSDLVALGGGRYIMLRRSWSERQGFSVMVEELVLSESSDGVQARTRQLHTFARPDISENFEGVAIRREGNRTFLYMIADDNFDPGSRTILAKFALEGLS
ncbi:esterase-like activity of phytase family protein [Sphingomonas sp. LH128]|uniref:esterase-like activity of phytase family protein n=1 Tax=Sphingomonas sp. LH128 TaxID=473781 RepID=UPI00155DF470|nr:esterase-like activity of phytase family protein [Sphingomonas sp. LH128]